jgi:dephospho-CoA kinase
MLIVGLTGGIGSGKSAVTAILQNLGITIVDADIVARQAVEPDSPALKQIIRHFGAEITDSEGRLDRAKLRSIIFADSEAKDWLEKLLHPVIREMIIAQLAAAHSAYAVLASPLLFETDQHLLTQHNVVIDVPEELQIHRTTLRDSNSTEQVKAIIAAQMPRLERNKRADTLICNDKDLDSLQHNTQALHQKLLKLARQHNDQR